MATLSCHKFIRVAITVGAFAVASCVYTQRSFADAAPAQITVLYDAFGANPALKKDWGFSALIEYGGKRILFDTGNNDQVFAHNAEAMGVDLTKLDFAVISHRHGDHTGGLNHLLRVNPRVEIYVPQENFGMFGAELPGSFYKSDETLPPQMRYFDGQRQQSLRFGTPWPEANFHWITTTTEVAPGIHLILLNGKWGADLEVKELSLAIDTPDGIVLVVGCSHPTIEKIVAEAKGVTGKPIHLVLGGTHLLPAKADELQAIVAALHDTYKIDFIAPAHCTGEPAFAALKAAFRDNYVYAGLGSTVVLGRDIRVKAEAGQPAKHAMADGDLADYRRALRSGPLKAFLRYYQ